MNWRVSMEPMISSGSWVVFYHLRYPFLNIVARKVKRLMVFQTLTMPGKLMNGAGSDPSLEEREFCSMKSGRRWRLS